MAMKPWSLPTWAELEEDSEDSSEDIQYFLDAVVSLLPPGKSRDDLQSIYQSIPGAMGSECHAVMMVFLPEDSVFQNVLGMVVYRGFGDKSYFIRQ